MNTSEKKLNININSQRKTSANEEFDELKKIQMKAIWKQKNQIKIK